MRILVVDDERPVRDALERALRLEGYEVETAADGQEALFALARRRADAIVLDVMMPVLDGLEVCRRLRRRRRPHAVLMLTARDARVATASPGSTRAPTTTSSSRSRSRSCWRALRALLRRAGSADGELAALRRPRARPAARARCAAASGAIELTRTEFLLLELFMRHPRQVLTRDVIFDRVWGYDFGAGLELARGLRRLPAPEARGGAASRA